MKGLLIIFVKNPVHGKVKSRLAAKVGADKALSIYRKLLDRTRQVVSEIPFDKLVCYSNEIDRADIWSNNDFKKDLQKGRDLGQRMYYAIEKASDDLYEKICLIGSDNMEITPEIIIEAYNSLDDADIVLGPSRDGGYYLIGMKQPIVEIFELGNWSTTSVLEETIAIAKSMELTYHLLAELNDIDELEDINDQDQNYLLS